MMNEEAQIQQLRKRIPLTEGTSLHHRYNVLRPVRCDGAAIAYAGMDYIAQQPVTVLEFFPERIAVRTENDAAISPSDKASGALFFLGMEAFYRQYNKLLQTIGSPNILSVFDAFFANGTAYAVAEVMEGLTLHEYVARQQRKLTDGELVYIAHATADALLVVHSCNLLHHGISERTILLSLDGTVKLIDFAAGLRTVSEGHAVRDDEPWEDIHALGETLYHAYTGGGQSIVPMCMDEAVPRTLSTLFAGMLSENPSQRFTSVFDLRYTVASMDIVPVCPEVEATKLLFDTDAPALPEIAMDELSSLNKDTVSRSTAEGKTGNGRNIRLAAAIGVALLLLLGILIWALLRW